MNQNKPEPSVSALVRAASDALYLIAPNGHPDFNARMIEAARLHSRKNADYSGEEGPLGNFERVARVLEIYPIFSSPKHLRAKVAIMYILKQFDAVMNSLAEGRDLETESISGRIDDMAVYWPIIRIMIEEENQEGEVEVVD